MSTDQKYAENPANPYFIDLTVKQPVNQDLEQAPCLEHPMAEEWRQNHYRYQRELRELEAAQTPAINESLSVFDLINAFVGETPSAENVSVIRELERGWLAQKDPKLAGTRVHIHTLRILTFLVSLHKKWTEATKHELELVEPICNDAEEGLSYE